MAHSLHHHGNDKTSATAVAVVIAPIDPSAGPRPVITWEHASTGLLQKCMPSLWSDPAFGIPAIDRIAGANWVIVAMDYSFAEKGGPLPYLIGEGEARAALDSVRAARQMPELKLDTRTVVWGHSQGGHAALWTGIVGPRYAPDVKIVGVAWHLADGPADRLDGGAFRERAAGERLCPPVLLTREQGPRMGTANGHEQKSHAKAQSRLPPSLKLWTTSRPISPFSFVGQGRKG